MHGWEGETNYVFRTNWQLSKPSIEVVHGNLVAVFFLKGRILVSYPARALRALGLLLADGTPTGGRGEDFLSRQPDFFTQTAVTPERKVEKSFPRWEINRHVEG